MKNKGKKVIALFLISVIVYGVIVSFFTSTVHIDVDEELYIALARSFHYEGRFEYGRQLLNYNCVLYSMLISLTYFFYSPETILLMMRILGVVTMCSSVFPIFLIAEDILKDSRKALSITAFLLAMPYMFDSAYMMQEVLAYPLFMWTVYFMHRAFTGTEQSRKILFVVLGAFFSILCVFTKTYMFFIPIVINLCFFYSMLKVKKGKKSIWGIIIYDGVYLLLFAGMYFMVFAINGFEQGSNHYASQFSHLFPISVNTIVYGVMGCVVYAAFLVINTGIVPLLSVGHQWRHEKKKSWDAGFLLTSCVFLVVEIVFMIVLTEEGVGTPPHKFLFRYFQIFVPLILILFIRQQGEDSFWESRKTWMLSFASMGVAVVYFLCMQGKTRQSIMDGHLFLFMENVSKYVIPYADVIIIAVVTVLTVIAAWFYRKNTDTKRIIRLGMLITGIFWMIQVVQLPYYTNSIAGGRVIQNDSIQIANYLNREEYEYLYYVYENEEEENSYIRNFYGYIKQPYQLIEKSDVAGIIKEEQEKKIAFLLPVTDREDNVLLKKVNLDTERMALYIP